MNEGEILIRYQQAFELASKICREAFKEQLLRPDPKNLSGGHYDVVVAITAKSIFEDWRRYHS